MDYFYSLQIFFLSLFQPSKLFEKINALPWYQGLLEEWVEDNNLPEKSHVLEIGSATGALSHYLASKHKLVSVDRSSEMIKRAKENHPYIDFRVADALNLPFDDAIFDVVLASSLINVLDDKQQALDEMLRVCKKDGKVMLLFPLEGFDDDDLLKLGSKMELKGFSKMALAMWHKLAKKMSLESLALLLKESNFKILSTQTYLGGMVAGVVVKAHV